MTTLVRKFAYALVLLPLVVPPALGSHPVWGDEFERTSLGPDWETVEGSVTVDGNNLVLSADHAFAAVSYAKDRTLGDGALAFRFHPGSSAGEAVEWKEMYVSFRWRAGTGGWDVHRVEFRIESHDVCYRDEGVVCWPFRWEAMWYTVEVLHAGGVVRVRIDDVLVGETSYPASEPATQLNFAVADDGTGHRIDWIRFREPDFDHDGVLDAEDNCERVPNPGQEDFDGDGVGDACESDIDGDGVPDDGDNCVDRPNPGQEDLDADGVGDVCDTDGDGDGIPDEDDNCAGVANADQGDADADGLGDACDASPFPRRTLLAGRHEVPGAGPTPPVDEEILRVTFRKGEGDPYGQDVEAEVAGTGPVALGANTRGAVAIEDEVRLLHLAPQQVPPSALSYEVSSSSDPNTSTCEVRFGGSCLVTNPFGRPERVADPRMREATLVVAAGFEGAVRVIIEPYDTESVQVVLPYLGQAAAIVP